MSTVNKFEINGQSVEVGAVDIIKDPSSNASPSAMSVTNKYSLRYKQCVILNGTISIDYVVNETFGFDLSATIPYNLIVSFVDNDPNTLNNYNYNNYYQVPETITVTLLKTFTGYLIFDLSTKEFKLVGTTALIKPNDTLYFICAISCSRNDVYGINRYKLNGVEYGTVQNTTNYYGQSFKMTYSYNSSSKGLLTVNTFEDRTLFIIPASTIIRFADKDKTIQLSESKEVIYTYPYNTYFVYLYVDTDTNEFFATKDTHLLYKPNINVICIANAHLRKNYPNPVIYNGPYSYNGVIYSDFNSTYVDKINDCVSLIESLRGSLVVNNIFSGKNIVLFGDSLCERKDTTHNKTFAEYISEYTGANVINCGIGGGYLAARSANLVTDITTQSQAYNALDVYNMVSAACSLTYTALINAANYLKENTSDDNTQLIENLSTTDWSTVDAVMIFCGTNDWNNNNTLGDENSTEITKCVYATKEIIKMLGQTYPHIKIYWFTPIVRWVTYENDSFTEDSWSDDLVREGNGTLKLFSAKIKETVESLHIPCCDMYNTLGWNKYNFSNWFVGRDGTHPATYAGVSGLAKKMISFISSNNAL